MDTDKEKRSRMIFQISFVIAIISFVAFAGLAAAQAYVRWSLNQDFTFLGGYGLESLALISFGLFLGLLRGTRE